MAAKSRHEEKLREERRKEMDGGSGGSSDMPADPELSNKLASAQSSDGSQNIHPDLQKYGHVANTSG